MNKIELISAISKKNNTTMEFAETLLNSFLDVVTEELVNGGSVQLVGFGVFSVQARAPRKGHNPHTHEEIKIPACNAPTFKPGKALKEIVNK